ncbi:MAG: methyltransferase domain-containing protein [Pseudomonadales bacterium]|jgi:protein-L-isoaspartate O-methyltransferase|nr:methyltransferase domain-containing protein [Pseudomonadales bacterium]
MSKQKPELHLFLLWENARVKEKKILTDIEATFEVVEKIEIIWSKEKFSENLSRFYGTSLPAGCGKEQHCGTGPFTLIIVKDVNPNYENRMTSKGMKLVNAKMFDKKEHYRKMTGGGHQIHGTNDVKETNHNLSLLLGMGGVDDYIQQNKKHRSSIKLDLAGGKEGGWKNIEELFLALNNTTNYAVLRNYDSLPNEFYLDGHEDIDLLCENTEECAFILNAKKVFDQDWRVHYEVIIDGKPLRFDLREVGDNYYDISWEKDLLKQKQLLKNCFYAVVGDNHYYSLLYHALIHKPKLGDDYQLKLSKISKKKISYDNAVTDLGKWLSKNKYKAWKPIDYSVFFNEEVLAQLPNDTNPYVNVEANIKNEDDNRDNNKLQHISNLSKQLVKNDGENVSLETQKNILDWYEFKPKSTILEIGTGIGSLTKLLAQRAKQVTTISSSINDVRTACLYCKKYNNIKYIIDDWKNFETKNKFDYIIVRETKNLGASLTKAEKLISANGVIIVIAKNKLGLEELMQRQNYYDIDVTKTDKNELQNLIKKGSYQHKLFYAFPSVITSNQILTDAAIDKGISLNLSGNSQSDLLSAVIDNNLVGTMTGGFVAVLSKKLPTSSLPIYIGYNNDSRKKEFALKTIITADKKVIKTPIDENAQAHLANIHNNSSELRKLGLHVLENEFKNLPSLTNYLSDLYQKNDTDSIMKTIDNYFEEINKAKSDCCYVDLIPQNCLIDGQKFLWFDQEWKIDTPIDSRYILYRGLKLFYSAKQNYETVVPFENILTKYKITPKLQSSFEQLEKEFQSKILSETTLDNNKEDVVTKVQNAEELRQMAKNKEELNRMRDSFFCKPYFWWHKLKGDL